MKSWMRAVALAAVLLALLASQAMPVQIFVWDKDNGKSFQNPEGAGNVGCQYGIQQALTANGYTYTTSTSLPADISTYDIIFIVLGWC